ncbi:MAG: GntR family transcriptional regulator [Victivallaceae bacterium]|jgi:DNA-binding LacI/PurR family transcriptional regulator
MSEAIPSYLKIRQYVFSCIANAKLDGGAAKIHTEEELCKIYGVCRTTVRKALNHFVAEGLIVRKQRLGTFIRTEIIDSFNINFGKTLTLGLIYGDGMVTFLDEYFMSQTAEVFQSMVNAECLCRQLYFDLNPEKSAVRLEKSKLDGIIWMSPSRCHAKVFEIFKALSIPVVSTFPLFLSDDLNSVELDYYKCGYKLAEYLLKRGHKKILYINKNPPDVNAVKKAGCMAAFADRKAAWNEHLWYCGFNSLSELQIRSVIKNAGDFSAVNCHAGYVSTVKDELAGRKEIQIIHNTCSASAAASSGSAEILLPTAQAGKDAVDILLNIINKRTVEPVRKFVESRIVEPGTM